MPRFSTYCNEEEIKKLNNVIQRTGLKGGTILKMPLMYWTEDYFVEFCNTYKEKNEALQN